MTDPTYTSAEDLARFEIFPAGSIETQAAELPRAAHITITCSPKHGPDHSIEAAGRLRDLGHTLTVHVAARMVRDRSHLDALLAAMKDAGADDLFLVAGDIEDQLGEYASAVELLPLVAEHPQRPTTIGITGYPEDHPFISDEDLEQALRDKCRHADYITTQMCFDPDTLRDWVVRHRERGLTLPVVIGMPGKVKRKRLLTMSAQIGVGPFVPMRDEPDLKLAGFNYYTFNQLLETWEWHQRKLEASGMRSQRHKESVHDTEQPAGAPGPVG